MRRSSSDRSGVTGTPMKMLIAQEIAKEGNMKQKTTTVVARLMGLNNDVDLPRPAVPSSRSFSDGHLSATLARVNNQIPFQKHTSSVDDVQHKDVYEVGYQPPRGERLLNEYPRRRPNENHDKGRMDRVRQKFVEAKRRASHNNLLQPEEFHDALEVLNSNKDLFLKFLEEPNSLFANQSGELHSAATSPQRKCITLLKPSKSVETKGNKESKRQKNQRVDGNITERSNLHKSDAGDTKEERLPKHTRIVVLKPSSAITSVEQFEQNYHGVLDDSEAPVISRHLSDDITWSVHDLCCHHDDSLQGCMQSNMFSTDRSYHEYAEEEGTSLNDSEIGTPTSCHSWDYIYRFNNPCFRPYISHASCSRESLASREAKKHMSDRWATAPSNELGPEMVPVRRSLSTLGETFAMSNLKKGELAGQVSPHATNQLCSNGPRLVLPSNCYVDDDGGASSFRKITTSISVPVFSSTFDGLHLDGVFSDKKRAASKKVKPKNGKSSLKRKISSFFSKRKKSEKEKVTSSPLGTSNGRVPLSSNALENLEDPFESGPTVVPINEHEALSTSKSPISLEKILSFDIRNSHFDQPSPTSVLDAQFEDVNEKSPSSFESAITAKQEALSRSFPIRSMSRTLSWDDAFQEATLWSTERNQEQEQYEFVQKVLSSAGFCNEKTHDIFVQWHSLDCPMDPTVLNQLLERKVEDAKCRERRSNQRLLIDSVNAALLEIGQNKLWGAYPCTEQHANAQRVATCDVLVTDEVWRLVKEWLFDDDKSIVDGLDNAGLAADWVVDREIHGKGWSEMLCVEMDEISKEICEEVLSKLVGEAFTGLAGCH